MAYKYNGNSTPIKAWVHGDAGARSRNKNGSLTCEDGRLRSYGQCIGAVHRAPRQPRLYIVSAGSLFKPDGKVSRTTTEHINQAIEAIKLTMGKIVFVKSPDGKGLTDEQITNAINEATR